MGNRAVIVLEAGEGKKIERGSAIYLQWNGGSESVYAFMDELEKRGMRVNDVGYETARLVHVIGDYFDIDGITTLSLGMYNLKNNTEKELLKNYPGDNGIYLINRAKKTVRRYVADDNGERKWLTKEEIVKEIEDAIKSKKYKGILAELKKDRKGKKIEN